MHVNSICTPPSKRAHASQRRLSAGRWRAASRYIGALLLTAYCTLSSVTAHATPFINPYWKIPLTSDEGPLVSRATVPAHLSWLVQIYDIYALRPITYTTHGTGAFSADLITHANTLHLGAALGLWNRYALAAGIPLTTFNTATAWATSQASTSPVVGNPWLAARAALLAQQPQGPARRWDLALQALLQPPLAPAKNGGELMYRGKGWQGSMDVLLSRYFKYFRADASVGLLLRRPTDVMVSLNQQQSAVVPLGQALSYGLGLTLPLQTVLPSVVKNHEIDAVLQGSGITDLRQAGYFQANTFLGLRWSFWRGLVAQLGAGPGLGHGEKLVGARLLAVASLAYQPRPAPPPPPPPEPAPEPAPEPQPPPPPPPIVLTPAQKAVELELSALKKHIEFLTASATLVRESRRRLKKVAQLLTSEGGKHIWVRVEGHADQRGSEAYNLRLSAKRAAAVGRWLSQNGVEAERLNLWGCGEQRLITTENLPTAWKKNRRTEFHVMRIQDKAEPTPAYVEQECKQVTAEDVKQPKKEKSKSPRRVLKKVKRP